MPSTTPSSTPSIVSTFDADNRDLEARTRAVFESFAAESGRHARLLNTLSLLEHLGSRKIMATQSGPNLDEDTLKHLSEETRHAFFFKRQAEKVAGDGLTFHNAEMAAPNAAWMYFQRLDATVARMLGISRPTRAAYLFMSLAVELRAVWAYTIYQAVLETADPRVSLKSLLAEEEGHLRGMVEDLQAIGAYDVDRVRAFAVAERRLYTHLLRGLEREFTGVAEAA